MIIDEQNSSIHWALIKRLPNNSHDNELISQHSLVYSYLLKQHREDKEKERKVHTEQTTFLSKYGKFKSTYDAEDGVKHFILRRTQ